MISFVNVNDNEKVDTVVAKIAPECRADAEMMIEDFRGLATEITEVAISESDGCMLVRVLDGGDYMFIFPIMLSEVGNPAAALLALSEYVRREMLPFLLTDVPREGVDILTDVFAHVDARAYDDDEDIFAAIVKNELDMIEEYPTVTSGDVTLSPITDADAAAYTRLCSDRDLNKYWGFDDLADNPSASAELFMLIVEREKKDGIALSLAVRRDGKYLGEGVIYNCDFNGEAEIGVRILPEFQGVGVGLLALDGIIKYCREIGITTMRARVKEENIPAIKLMKKRFVETERRDGVVYLFAPVTGFELLG